MLQQAEKGILFKPPQKVIHDYPEFPVANDYDRLKELLEGYYGEKT
jgi:phosphoserine/homoserine phosphotransferase